MTSNPAPSTRIAARRPLPGRQLAAACVAALGLAACSDVTNLKEKSLTFISPDTYYQNDADANNAVNGVYEPLLGWNMWRSPAQSEAMCDDPEMICQNWMGGGFGGSQSGQWYIGRTWTGNYQIIQRANDVIANVSKSTAITPAGKKLAIGQALFARGYAYFELARRYGAAPIRTTPYVPESTLGDLARNPTPEVYGQAIKDLRAAADSLPASYSTVNGQGRPRQATAWGMLSRAYLYMAGNMPDGSVVANKAVYYDSARVAASKVMQDASVSLEPDYMTVFDVVKQNASPEILFAVQASAAQLQGSDIPNYFGPQGDCTIVGGCGSGFISLREDFYNTFDKARDKRVQPNKAIARAWEYTNSPVGNKVRVLSTDSLTALMTAGIVKNDVPFRYGAWTEACGAYGTNFDSLTVADPSAPNATRIVIMGVARPVYTLKWLAPGTTVSAANTNNFIILRYADVLLTFAEAENEASGPTSAAYNAVNQVRARAGLPALTGLSKEQFRQAVWTERQHELFGEFQSKFELVRQGRWLALMNQPSTIPDYATQTVSGQNVCRPRVATQQLFPLPQSELAGNGLAKQNPGY